MEGDGQQFAYQKYIAPASATVSFAKPLSRAVIGSINDLVFGAKLYLDDDMAPYEVGFVLNETPLSMLGYLNPKAAYKNLAI
jgi:hypothetical protein